MSLSVNKGENNNLSSTKQPDSKVFTHLLNGTITSMKNVIPLQINFQRPQAAERSLKIEFGVLIGITGDLKGKMILSGSSAVFASVGEKMFGMQIEGEMLTSFSGELGNMIAGGMSTNVIESGIKTDITYPVVLEGNTALTGFKKGIKVPVSLGDTGEMDIYLLLD